MVISISCQTFSLSYNRPDLSTATWKRNLPMRSMIVVITLLALALPGLVQAKDTEIFFPIKEAMSSDAAKEQLSKNIRFYFGKNSTKYKRSMGTFTANRKTNAFNKSDKEACDWVFLSALLALQDRAIASGGNAIVDIHSYYKKNAMYSAEKYECHDGAFITGVALRGKVVKK